MQSIYPSNVNSSRKNNYLADLCAYKPNSRASFENISNRIFSYDACAVNFPFVVSFIQIT